MYKSTRDKEIDAFVCERTYGKTFWDEKSSYDNTLEPGIMITEKPGKEIVSIYKIRSLVMKRAHEMKSYIGSWSNCQGLAWKEIKTAYSW